MLFSYLTRRAASVVGAFANFGLEPTGYFPAYQTVQKVERNYIEFFGNLGPENHAKLATEITG